MTPEHIALLKKVFDLQKAVAAVTFNRFDDSKKREQERIYKELVALATEQNAAHERNSIGEQKQLF